MVQDEGVYCYQITDFFGLKTGFYYYYFYYYSLEAPLYE